MANGWPLARDRLVLKARFSVGQQIHLDSYLTPSIEGSVQNAYYEWFLPNVFVNYIENRPHDAKKYLIEWSLLWAKDTRAWWVTGGEKHPRCDWFLTLNNG